MFWRRKKKPFSSLSVFRMLFGLDKHVVLLFNGLPCIWVSQCCHLNGLQKTCPRLVMGLLNLDMRDTSGNEKIANALDFFCVTGMMGKLFHSCPSCRHQFELNLTASKHCKWSCQCSATITAGTAMNTISSITSRPHMANSPWETKAPVYDAY